MTKKTLWFGQKKYGFGWTPLTWQGWAIVAVYTIGILSDLYVVRDHATFLLHALLYTVLLIAICYLKGETPRWNWGKKKKK